MGLNNTLTMTNLKFILFVVTLVSCIVNLRKASLGLYLAREYWKTKATNT